MSEQALHPHERSSNNGLLSSGLYMLYGQSTRHVLSPPVFRDSFLVDHGAVNDHTLPIQWGCCHEPTIEPMSVPSIHRHKTGQTSWRQKVHQEELLGLNKTSYPVRHPSDMTKENSDSFIFISLRASLRPTIIGWSFPTVTVPPTCGWLAFSVTRVSGAHPTDGPSSVSPADLSRQAPMTGWSWRGSALIQTAAVGCLCVCLRIGHFVPESPWCHPSPHDAAGPSQSRMGPSLGQTGACRSENIPLLCTLYGAYWSGGGFVEYQSFPTETSHPNVLVALTETFHPPCPHHLHICAPQLVVPVPVAVPVGWAMAPISDERFDAAYQRIRQQMERRRRANPEPAEHQDEQQSHTRPEPAAAKRDDRRDAHRQPSREQASSHDRHPRTQSEVPAEEAAGWSGGWCVLLPVARAVLAVVWSVAYCVMVKPMCRVTKFVFLILAVLAFFALIAAWVINTSLGGLHALHVWACDDILPQRLFFVDWCPGTNAAHPHLPAAAAKLPPSSSAWAAWAPLTPTELSLLQKPDRHFCVYGFGDLLGGMADEQHRYMTERQRESFAVMRKAGAVVEQLREIGRKQARTVDRAQDKMVGLMNDGAAPLSERHRPSLLPPPSAAWSGSVWLWTLFAGRQPALPPLSSSSSSPPSVFFEGIIREISHVIDGEATSRKQFVRDVAALSQDMGQVASSVCDWNMALAESISDKMHSLREARRRNRPTPWWQRKVLFVDRGGPGQVTKGTASEMRSWEDQAAVVRNDIIMWRRRKAKANLVCRMLTEGAGRTARLLKAIQDEEAHLVDMAQGAADLVIELSSQESQVGDDMLQRWSKARVCRSDVEHLRVAGTHISFAAGCRRRMWQHVIRFRLSPATAAFKQWDRIARELYLVRPDGLSWGPGWDLVVHRKIQAALARFASDATRLELVREVDGERVWEEWAEGFLCVEWDGSCFDPAYARSLLERAADADDDERRQRRRYEDEIAALGVQLRELGHLPVVPPRRHEDMSDHGVERYHRPAVLAAIVPVDGPAPRGRDIIARNDSAEFDIVPGDSVSRMVVNSDALSLLPSVPRGDPRPAAAAAASACLAVGNKGGNTSASGPVTARGDVTQFWANKSLAELEAWLRQGWARLFHLRVQMLEALFSPAAGGGRGRRPDLRRVVAIREAREKLLEEIFFLEDIVDDRQRPLGAVRVPYPGQGFLWKYFLGGDGPSPAMEARVSAAQRPYL
ncbi:hypothetical protein CSUB01_11210 [Colletotrichum sublineola]|uniref:Uncharacterized protein n=1 Tax=Colletotrichum sublineola TaxID=1173701 RepID=A0A066XRB3_COLSU|nr:hypothetical protein CSUB01_11210 [Colletotrichum sublineola]